MFGYVVPNEALLTKQQLSRFKRVYCGVCAQLCRGCGKRGRFTLTYDAAFLALVLNALYEAGEDRQKSRCPMHPLFKNEFESGEMAAYAADINIILCYYSLLDGYKDDKNLLKKAGADFIEDAFTRACARRADKAQIIRQELNKLKEFEDSVSSDIDGAAGCFGHLLGSVFACKDDQWAPALYRMGDALGRYIYILDAYCDLKKDIKSGSYNPLKALSRQNDYEDTVYGMLKTEMALCAHAFETLPIVQDIELMRNVLYSGVWKGYISKRKSVKTMEDSDGKRPL